MSEAARGVVLAVGLAIAAGALTVWAVSGVTFGPIAGFFALLLGCAGFASLALVARAANIKGHASTSLDDLSPRDKP